MLYNRTVDRIVIVVVPVALFVYASTRPHLRLRADMPPDFVDSQASANPMRRAEEERQAKEYWQCALNFLQWKYTYGAPLPTDPPDEFRLRGKPPTGSIVDPTSRTRYWKRLQKAWLLPSSWVTSREWSIQWLTDPVEKTWDWIVHSFDDLIK